jgi:hypothetical protein
MPRKVPSRYEFTMDNGLIRMKLTIPTISGPLLIEHLTTDQILNILKQETRKKEQRRSLTLEFPKIS